MDRRQLLGAMGVGVVGTLAAGGTAVAADGHDEHLEIMARCARLCAEAARHCLDQLRKGSSDAEKHARALAMTAACEEFCILSAKQSACGSPLAGLAHQANAQACERCARTCDEVEGEVMKACAEMCRKCAQACREMAKHADHDAASR